MSGTHILTGEHSHLRRWTLYIFARYVERPLLAWGYRLLRGRYRRWGQNRLVRAALGWLVAAPFSYLGDTARPIPCPEVLRMIATLDGPIAVGPCRCRNATVVPLLTGRVNVSFFCTGGITWGRNRAEHLVSGWPWPDFVRACRFADLQPVGGTSD